MKQETNVTLTFGRDVFTSEDLLKKAAAFLGLELKYMSGSRATSNSIKEYVLDGKLLKALAEKGIRRHDRPDDIFTLADENPQKTVPGWSPSNFWNFELFKDGKKGYDLRIALQANFRILQAKRGVMFWPMASGYFVSASDSLPNYRMFKALVENDESAPDIAKRLAESDEIVVTWTDMGLGGIRAVDDLFEEFSPGKDTIKQVARNTNIFNPAPYGRSVRSSQQDLFLAEPIQPKVMQAWKKQLEQYRASLIV